MQIHLDRERGVYMNKSHIMSWGCPNCLTLLSGICDKEGYVRLVCHKCGAVMVMKKMSRRQHILEITAPQGQIGLYR